jgi:S-DNA-T family DNA segregation ATPase FtsK/SpoIIIE
MSPRPLVRTQRKRKPDSRWVPESLRNALVSFLRRLQGGAIILAALAWTLALASYNALDPSFNTASPPATPHNWLGLFGSYTADLARQAIGLAAFVPGIVLAAWGWLIATERGLNLLFWRLLATAMAALAAAYALAAVQPFNDPVSGSTDLWGGAFGKLVNVWVTNRLPGKYAGLVMAPLVFMIFLGALYMAAALTLEEWRDVAALVHGFIHKTLARVRLLWHEWRHGPDNMMDGFDDDAALLATPKPVPRLRETPEKTESAKRARATLIQRPAASARQARLALRSEGSHTLPPLELLQWPETASKPHPDLSEDALEKNAKLLEAVLADFGVYGQITKVSPGPIVTLYELEPSPGTRSSRVISLADDIARNMSAASVRVAVVPGRNVIGIELPNSRREIVYLRELLSNEAYADYTGSLPLVLGKDIAGNPVITDLSRMPHLLIAGTTGSGKSVAINTMILSLIYRLPPEKCRFIMVDPKMLELSLYEGIPHLLAPVVTEPKKAIVALKWTVREMEERYRAMSKLGVRNIDGYNIRLREAAKNGENLTRTVQTGFDRETGKPVYEEQPLDLTPLPYIVVIIDEMADLMIASGKDIEAAAQRLAQMARAAGIHLIMATQRPSVDVITGTIKANFPTRVSFQVTSKIDSRTILNEQGAEQLLGNGDMLYQEGGIRVKRVHGPLVRDKEVEAIVKFLKKQGEPEYLDEVTEEDESDLSAGETSGRGDSGNELYDKAVDIVLRERKATISFIQRRLSIGYNKAATLIERMEHDGIIGQANHVGKREVFGRQPDD